MLKINAVIPFDEFYEEYFGEVTWYIFRKIGHMENAEDMASDIFVTCYQKYETYDPTRASLGTWLYTIVNNKLKNYYRDKKSNVSIHLIPEIPGGEDVDPTEASIYIEQARNVVAEAISALPEREQFIIVLKFFGSKQSDEIGRILNMSAGNVRVIISRALKKMSDYLKKNGWEKEI